MPGSVEIRNELLLRHLQLVLEANEHTNVTAIKDYEQGKLLHVEDSLAGLPEVEDAMPGALADLGSGAGYPGIPLAIATGRTTTLVESNGKKVEYLKRFIQELELEDHVSVFYGRAEELAKGDERFSVVTARALASLASLMELASPLLVQGGNLVCYKADVSEELPTAKLLQEKLALELVSTRELVLSDNETKRTIVVFKKVGEPTVKLPRSVGKAQKNPYKK